MPNELELTVIIAALMNCEHFRLKMIVELTTWNDKNVYGKNLWKSNFKKTQGSKRKD